ncbi:hypothetical protein L9F63_028260, partial [Diploptera punctata]
LMCCSLSELLHYCLVLCLSRLCYIIAWFSYIQLRLVSPVNYIQLRLVSPDNVLLS